MWLQQATEGDSGSNVDVAAVDKEEPTTGGAIICGNCGAAITEGKHRVARGGAHRHTQMNPHGYFYTLLCFAEATGVRQLGGPSDEWSWFEGFAWIIGDCASCGVHLGWRFVPITPEAGEPFYGLIEERLREVSGPAD